MAEAPKGLFKTHLRGVLGSLDLGLQLKNDTASQINFYLELLGRKLGWSASKLAKHGKKKTISQKEVRNAVRIHFIGALRTGAMTAGASAVSNTAASEVKNAAEKKKAGESKSPRKHGGAEKAHLNFSTSRCKTFLKVFKLRMSAKSPIYLAGVLEYVAAELLAAAGNHTLNAGPKNKAGEAAGRTKITPRDLMFAVHRDYELIQLSRSIHFHVLGGGVIPLKKLTKAEVKEEKKEAKKKSPKAKKTSKGKKKASKKPKKSEEKKAKAEKKIEQAEQKAEEEDDQEDEEEEDEEYEYDDEQDE
jgi:histone H2A